MLTQILLYGTHTHTRDYAVLLLGYAIAIATD